MTKKYFKLFRIALISGVVSILNLSAQITFTEHLIDGNTHGIGSIFACDLDGDMDLDAIAACLEDNQILWFRNDGGNPISWTKIIIGSNVYNAHSVYAADLDNDEDLDVVGAAYYGTPGIAWWRNDGGNPVVWTKFTIAPNFINAHEVYACDLDKDDDFDILGASSDLNTIAWWRNDGGNSITWTEQVLSDNVTLAKSVHVGDFDGDNEILWWRNDGNGSTNWTEFVITENFVRPWPFHHGDFDGDEDIDIISGSSHEGSNEIKWWENDGVVGIYHNNKSSGDKISIECYPNPFSSTTIIEFEVKEPSKVSLTIFDIFGEEVKILINNTESSILKTITWDGKNSSGQNAPSGVYYCRLQSNEGCQCKKIQYLRK